MPLGISEGEFSEVFSGLERPVKIGFGRCVLLQLQRPHAWLLTHHSSPFAGGAKRTFEATTFHLGAVFVSLFTKLVMVASMKIGAQKSATLPRPTTRFTRTARQRKPGAGGGSSTCVWVKLCFSSSHQMNQGQFDSFFRVVLCCNKI